MLSEFIEERYGSIIRKYEEELKKKDEIIRNQAKIIQEYENKNRKNEVKDE